MQTRIYFDNAATTPLNTEVLDAMMPYLTTHFGNPSSSYSYGRETRKAIENARGTIAQILGADAGEIFFTSGATESTNMAVNAAVTDLSCTRIITSPLEHHATLHAVENQHKKRNIEVAFVKVLPNGYIDINDLERLLSSSGKKTLVTLMHANNEIGNITDINAVGELCKKYGAVFYSDTVQTVGHFPFNLHALPVDFINGAAHKFHGPKGVGIIYISKKNKINPFVHGGAQEKNMRAGTENIYGIVGFAKALEIASRNYEADKAHISAIKNYTIQQLRNHIKGASFNGDINGCSLYTVLSVNFPKTKKSEMILFNLDINNICVSGGSACTSGANQSSHVIAAIKPNVDDVTIRFSFSKYNNKQEVDMMIEKLKTLL